MLDAGAWPAAQAKTVKAGDESGDGHTSRRSKPAAASITPRRNRIGTYVTTVGKTGSEAVLLRSKSATRSPLGIDETLVIMMKPEQRGGVVTLKGKDHDSFRAGPRRRHHRQQHTITAFITAIRHECAVDLLQGAERL